jgi:PhnB protein
MEDSPSFKTTPPLHERFDRMKAPPGGITRGNQISLSISCASAKEADALYSKLSKGGKATHPMKDEFFGYFGDLTDKYGLTWMLTYEKPRS